MAYRKLSTDEALAAIHQHYGQPQKQAAVKPVSVDPYTAIPQSAKEASEMLASLRNTGFKADLSGVDLRDRAAVTAAHAQAADRYNARISELAGMRDQYIARDIDAQEMAKLTPEATDAVQRIMMMRQAMVRDSSDPILKKELNQLESVVKNTGADLERVLGVMSRQKNAEEAEKYLAQKQQFAKEHPVAATVESFGQKAISGAGGVNMALQNAVNRLRPDEKKMTLDVNDPLNRPAQAASTMRSTVSGMIGESIQNEDAAKIAQWGYNTINSAVDSAINFVLAKGAGKGLGLTGAELNNATSKMTSALMGSQVATDAIIEGKEKGYSDDKAVAMGVVSALIEGVTEKYSIEQILSDPGTSILQAARNAFTAEGSEEVASNWLNRLADLAVNGDEAEMRREYNGYIAAGDSEYTALRKTLLSLLGEDVSAFLAGGISGVGMGGINYYQTARGYAEIGQMVEDGAVPGIIEYAKSMQGTEAAKLAEQAEQKKQLSDIQKGRLLFSAESGTYSAIQKAPTAEAAADALISAEMAGVSNPALTQAMYERVDALNNAPKTAAPAAAEAQAAHIPTQAETAAEREISPEPVETTTEDDIVTAAVEQLMAKIKSGAATNKQLDELIPKPQNTAKRQAFERMAGITLPNTAAATRAALREWGGRSVEAVTGEVAADTQMANISQGREIVAAGEIPQKSLLPITEDPEDNILPNAIIINDAKKQIESYGIKDINNSFEVENKVDDVLSKEHFFDDENRFVVNEKDGDILEITRKGTKETFGKYQTFKYLSLEHKKRKLAVYRYLPAVLKYGEIYARDQKNEHSADKPPFMYLQHQVVIEGEPYWVIVKIKQTKQGNKAWVHFVNKEKESPTRPTDGRISRTAGKISDAFSRLSIPQNNDGVKREYKDNETVENTVAPKGGEVDAEQIYHEDGGFGRHTVGSAESRYAAKEEARRLLEEALKNDPDNQAALDQFNQMWQSIAQYEADLAAFEARADALNEAELRMAEERLKIQKQTADKVVRDMMKAMNQSAAREHSSTDEAQKAKNDLQRYKESQQKKQEAKIVGDANEKIARLRGTASKKEETGENIAEVLTELPKDTTPRREKWQESYNATIRAVVNTRHDIEQLGAYVGDPQIKYAANNMGQAAAAAQYSIGEAQTDLYGEELGPALQKIFQKAKDAGLKNEFDKYLLHVHNIDRMSIKERTAKLLENFHRDLCRERPEFAKMTVEDRALALNKDTRGRYTEAQQEAAKAYRTVEEWCAKKHNLPIFGEKVTAEVSRDIAEELLRLHPEFKKWAEEVYAYNRGLMRVRLQAGIVDDTHIKRLEYLYPHYVPVYTNNKKGSYAVDDRGDIRINKTIKEATGGDTNILPLAESMARQTLQVFSNAKRNVLANRMHDGAVTKGDGASKWIHAVEEEGELLTIGDDADTLLQQSDKDYTLQFYKDGKPMKMYISRGIYEGFRSQQQAEDILSRITEVANKNFKRLVTQWNPMFVPRNFTKDLGTAFAYTKQPIKTFAQNYARAYCEIAKNGKMWRLYQSLGGTGSTYFDFDKGFKEYSSNPKVAKLQRGVEKLEQINLMVEQACRLAEFMYLAEKGGMTQEALQEALYGAADITVNFGRGGYMVRSLNRTIAPFLNAGVQGADRLKRNFTEAYDKSNWKPLIHTIVRFLSCGLAPVALNQILLAVFGDDEDKDAYNELQDYVRDGNILIPIGNKTFIKIATGRETSVVSSFINRFVRMANGKKDAFKGFGSFVGDQIAPNNPFTENLLSPFFIALGYNKTWYGGDLISQWEENTPKYLQYDESTDAFSIWLGELTRNLPKGLQISPKKFNYVLDQYSGFVGDFILPVLSKKVDVAVSDNALVNFVASPFVKAFATDAVTKNRLSEEFYDLKDDAEVAANDLNPAASDIVVKRYLNYQVNAASDINKQLDRIYNDDNLSRVQKRQQARELLQARNEIFRQALLNTEVYERTAKILSPKAADEDELYMMVNRELFGVEYALMAKGSSSYEAAKRRYAEGIPYEVYYDKLLIGDKANVDGTGTVSMEDAYLYLKDLQKTELYKNQMWKLLCPNTKKTYSQYAESRK